MVRNYSVLWKFFKISTIEGSINFKVLDSLSLLELLSNMSQEKDAKIWYMRQRLLLFCDCIDMRLLSVTRSISVPDMHTCLWFSIAQVIVSLKSCGFKQFGQTSSEKQVEILIISQTNSDQLNYNHKILSFEILQK